MASAQIAPPFVEGAQETPITVRCTDYVSFRHMLDEKKFHALVVSSVGNVTKVVAINSKPDVMVFNLVPADEKAGTPAKACVLDILVDATVSNEVRLPTDGPTTNE